MYILILACAFLCNYFVVCNLNAFGLFDSAVFSRFCVYDGLLLWLCRLVCSNHWLSSGSLLLIVLIPLISARIPDFHFRFNAIQNRGSILPE